jgi:hypothetical protein
MRAKEMEGVRDAKVHASAGVGAAGVGGEDHQRVLALLGDLERVVGVAERELHLPRGQRLHDLGPAPGDHEVGRLDTLLLEELLLRGHQVLAVDEGRDAVRSRDALQALGPGRP